MMFDFSPMELIVIGGLAVILFGRRFPPPFARAKLGRDNALDGRLRTDESRRPLVHELFIAAVVVEAVLVGLVIWGRLGR